MKYMLFLVATFLAGCASVNSLQSSCESTTKAFSDMVSCLDGKIAQDGRLSRHPGVKLYMLKANQLSQQVQAGNISELDAKVELQALFVQLDTQNQAEVDRLLLNTQMNQPVKTRCTTYAGVTNCTTR